jgi:hypothetical protein
MIILLDHNYTLVANSHEKRQPFYSQIDIEVYRPWLVKLVKKHHTILITARPARYKEETLKSILDKTGWQPQEAYFNSYGLPPPDAKETILNQFILPKAKGKKILAIESNPLTRAMYKKYNIPSIFIKGDTEWKRLPNLK